MIKLLELEGRGLYLDGEKITRQDALQLARRLIETWGTDLQRRAAFDYFELELLPNKRGR